MVFEATVFEVMVFETMTADAHTLLTGVVSIFLALIFLPAAWHKLRHPLEFAGVLRNYQVLPEWTVPAVARLLPVLELGLGLGLGASTIAAAPAAPLAGIAAMLLMIYAVAMSVNIVRGRTHIDCGCFRPESRQHPSWFLVFRNIVLAAAAGYAATVHASHAVTGVNPLLVYPAAACFAALYFAISAVSSVGRPQTAGVSKG